jgi:hypothetical protein
MKQALYYSSAHYRAFLSSFTENETLFGRYQRASSYYKETCTERYNIDYINKILRHTQA